MNNIQKIQENMYALYNMSSQELEPLVGQTYHRKPSVESESYACVVKLTEKDSWRMYNKLYNELELSLDIDDQGYFTPDRQLTLVLHSVDDTSWTAFIPYTGQDLFLLWSSIISKIRPTIDQLFDNNHTDNWYAFTHKYFLQITKELGVVEYEYD